MAYPIQQIFHKAYPGYRATHGVSFDADKVARAIMACKTAALGGNQATCEDCGAARVHYNSCRNRHCPCCQSLVREKWIDARKADVVDAPYFHAVFTVPSQLNPLIHANKRVLFDLLYRASADTLFELSRDERHLGADIGFISILHTWGSNLSFHPHVHAIVLGGGLSKSGKFVVSKSDFLFPIKAVSRLFRGKFLHGLKACHDQGTLSFPGDLSMLAYSKVFHDFLSTLYALEWIPYLKETFKGAANVIEYLGRYTHRIAISNSRILDAGEDSVTFRVKDYTSGTHEALTLENEEFLRRFLLHVLPRGFVRIRHYGLLSNRSKRRKMALVRSLVRGVCLKPRFRDLTALQILKEVFGIDPLACRDCGSRRLRKEALPLFHKRE